MVLKLSQNYSWSLCSVTPWSIFIFCQEGVRFKCTVNQLNFEVALILQISWLHINSIGLYKGNQLLPPKKGHTCEILLPQNQVNLQQLIRKVFGP